MFGVINPMVAFSGEETWLSVYRDYGNMWA